MAIVLPLVSLAGLLAPLLVEEFEEELVGGSIDLSELVAELVVTDLGTDWAEIGNFTAC